MLRNLGFEANPALAINIWYKYSLQLWQREKQRKRAAATLAQRAEAAQQQAPQQHQVKDLVRKTLSGDVGNGQQQVVQQHQRHQYS